MMKNLFGLALAAFMVAVLAVSAVAQTSTTGPLGMMNSNGSSAAGQVPRSDATTTNAPSWSTATFPNTVTVNRLLWVSATNVVSDLATANNGVLITSSGGVPSISSTLPAAVQSNITAVGTLASGAVPTTLLTGTLQAAQFPALTGAVTTTAGSLATTMATAQPDAHTWAATQTFTLAPVFTDASGSRTALGLGTMATQAASGVAITGGTIAGLTGLAIRDTSAAFDVTIAATSGTTLTAGRTLTLSMGNVAHTLAFGTTANTITFPNLASYTVITNGDTGSVTNTMLAGSIAASKLVGSDIATVGTLTAGATGAGFTIALSTSTVTGTLASARLPFPGASALGGVFSIDCSSGGQFVQKVNTDGSETCATPAGGGNVSGPLSSTNTAIARWNSTSGTALLDSGVTIDGSNNVAGMGTLASAAHTITSASATSLAVGRLGATTPAFQVDSSTGTQVAGLKITGAATGGTVALVATDSGSNTNLTLNAKGGGTIGIGSVSTGAVTITPATTITGALTLGNTGGAGQFLKQVSAGGVVSSVIPACGDLSNGATGCSTATGTSGATIPLLNGTNTWSGAQTFTGTGAVATFGNGGAGTTAANGIVINSGSGAGSFGNILFKSNGTSKSQIYYNINTDDLRFATSGVDPALIIGADGTVTLNTAKYASCTALTTNASAVIGCTVSARRFKNPLGDVPASTVANIDGLTPVAFSYKDKNRFDDRQHIGLYADDVCSIDERLCVRDLQGNVLNYEDRGVIALLVGRVGVLQARLEALEHNRQTTK